ncbi:MAG: DUF4416 family protein [Thermodesulfovibrionia bacterium]
MINRMGKITPSKTVKLFVGMLSSDISLFERLKSELEVLFGPCDIEGPIWEWRHSDYYAMEMGRDLKRRFIFFQGLIEPDSITEIKLKTNELEMGYLNERGGRRINLDPGYLDEARVVLVSTKDYSHRLYLRDGIYGEVTLIYSKGNYQALPYTYPDFRTEEYRGLFKQVRNNLKLTRPQTL